jgi:hypothetical protein
LEGSARSSAGQLPSKIAARASDITNKLRARAWQRDNTAHMYMRRRVRVVIG